MSELDSNSPNHSNVPSSSGSDESDRNVSLSDQGPSHDDFLADVLAGLSARPKSLPTRYLYDQLGSHLFDEICSQPEYYLTRSEQEIMDRYAVEMAKVIGEQALVVEYGSGASRKTRALLTHLNRPAAYVPLDISTQFLLASAEIINQSFPDLEVLPLAADFTKPFEIPQSSQRPQRTVVYFPGSTIGNFTPEQVRVILETIANVIGPNGALLIGIDLRKSESILHAAYNDAAGVTRRFILNILTRIQRELGAKLDVEGFHYEGRWNDEASRVEMSVLSKHPQTIQIQERSFHLAANERITVEYSYKYDDSRFGSMAHEAGLMLQRRWTDERELFNVAYLEPIVVSAR
jgi:L-histidine Nalpha-methyltransferase